MTHRRAMARELDTIFAGLNRAPESLPPVKAVANRCSPATKVDIYGFGRIILCSRAKIREFFKPGLFGDFSFVTLLELFAGVGQGRAASVTHAVAAAGVPPTTALRWIARSAQEDLVSRADDPLDGRRSHGCLTPPAFRAMHENLSCFLRLERRETHATVLAERIGPAVFN